MRPALLAACLGAFAAPAAAQEDIVARGAYLVNGIMACGNCHTPMGPQGPDFDRAFSGGPPLVEPGVFEAYGPNITPAALGDWSDAEVARAIREGLRPDGSIIGPPMPIELYRGISDEDLAAVVAYLRTLPTIENETPPSTYQIPLPPAYGPPVGNVAAPDPADELAWGAYLAGPLGHCTECHTPMGEGGRRDWSRIGQGGAEFVGPWGVSVAANITNDPEEGIGRYSDDELKAIITTGIRPDGERLLPPMGFGYYANMTDADLDALIAYLRTL